MNFNFILLFENFKIIPNPIMNKLIPDYSFIRKVRERKKNSSSPSSFSSFLIIFLFNFLSLKLSCPYLLPNASSKGEDFFFFLFFLLFFFSQSFAEVTPQSAIQLLLRHNRTFAVKSVVLVGVIEHQYWNFYSLIARLFIFLVFNAIFRYFFLI